MTRTRELRWSDLEHAAACRDPQFPQLVIDYVEQDDPPENQAEDAPAAAVAPPPLPADAWTLKRLRKAVDPGTLASQPEGEHRHARTAAWAALLGAPFPPPRLRLGALLIDMYDAGDTAGRAMLKAIFAEARLGFGLWRAFKGIYKRAEANHDAEMFGVLAWRIDALGQTKLRGEEISLRTRIYLKRRAWRFLRELGKAVPEAYPQFAVAVLRQYPRSASFASAWVAGHVWGHKQLLRLGQGGVSRPSEKMSQWAFPKAWKARPEPLLRLLEDAQADEVCAFAIIGLRTAFADRIATLEPAWLARLGEKTLPSVHDFVASVLRESPRFPPARLRELGLHELALALLRSPSEAARRYAIEYARAHVPEFSLAQLVELATCPHADTQAFAVERLERVRGSELGIDRLIALLGSAGASALARQKFQTSFDASALTAEHFVALSLGNRAQQQLLDTLYGKAEPPAPFLVALLEDKRLPGWQRARVLTRLGKLPAAEIGLPWIRAALERRDLSEAVCGWLREGKLRGDDVDVEWLTTVALRPRLRSTAIAVLHDPALVAPHRLDVDWLLAMLRHSDAELSGFAREHLLQHFGPPRLSVDTLWRLAVAESDAERGFAAAFLRLHHPELGPTQSEFPGTEIATFLPADGYSATRVLPLFDDARPDVRRLAQDIGRYEVLRWDDPSILYRLAMSRHREARTFGGECLLRIGQEDRGELPALPVSWLEGDAVFGLAEAGEKATREVALTLLRRHFDAVGGIDRLAWLMESPDREVRLFAVRQLWTMRDSSAPEALSAFLRTVLFGLPPGRVERREQSESDRLLAASAAKRRLVEVVRDFGVESRDFAQSVLPVLESFGTSQARGEREACVCAIATLRRAHPGLPTSLPPSAIPVRAPKRTRLLTAPRKVHP